MPPTTMRDAHLYSVAQPTKKRKTNNAISTSTTLSFTSQLSALISNPAPTSSTAAPNNARPARPARPFAAKHKDDIFTSHNRNTAKRAARDTDPSSTTFATQQHSTVGAPLDDTAWRRAKRNMEEKARLYAAMKRGDVEDIDERHMVDFDRKWAETTTSRSPSPTSSDNEASGDDDDDDDEGTVTYIDGLGRTRTGTKRDAEREKRRNAAADSASRSLASMAAHPAAPANIIYGDTVQSAAFNPDEDRMAYMDALAAQRDRETTPPETHFDANAEVRTKGVGFFKFSEDVDERKRQMEFLERERAETVRKRAEREREREKEKEIAGTTGDDDENGGGMIEAGEERRAARQKETEERARAQQFLDALGDEMAQSGEKGSENTTKEA